MTENELIGVRDPYGFRPLCLGPVDGAWVLASETCALDLIHARFVRDVEPGEVVFINRDGLTSTQAFPEHERRAFCIFEYVYFARPDSTIANRNVYKVRVEMGRQLAREYPIAADVVVPVPDSGNCAALGTRSNQASRTRWLSCAIIMWAVAFSSPRSSSAISMSA